MILDLLSAGRRSTKGRTAEVVAQVLSDQNLLKTLVHATIHPALPLRGRAAQAVKAISDEQPDWLIPYKEFFLEDLSEIEEWEVRSSYCMILPRLPLTNIERTKQVKLLKSFLNDESSIVKTCSLQAMCDLALQQQDLYNEVVVLIDRHTQNGTPAMRARCRKLIKVLNNARQ